jgi:23S rRNA (guanosine2251-2'-O)-methyltransferase
MGSEENGVSTNLLDVADYKAAIPMKGSIASLNVSVANGIILYEAVSQRLIS